MAGQAEGLWRLAQDTMSALSNAFHGLGAASPVANEDAPGALSDIFKALPCELGLRPVSVTPPGVVAQPPHPSQSGCLPLSEAFATMHRQPSRGPTAVFGGDLRRSAAKCAYMNACRQSQLAARSAQEHVDAYSKLVDAWDDRVLRVGDTVQCSNDDEHHRRHNSSYIPKSVLRLAFTRVGKATDRDGLEGTQKSLSICTTAARAAQLAQQRASSAHLATTPFVLARSYDLTPLRTDFGRIRPMLAPSARYLVPSSVGVKRWRPVPLEEYLRFKGIHTHVLPQRGVVELMGQSACIGIYDPESKSFNEELHLLQPVFCARSNASTIFRAVEQSIPHTGSAWPL